MNGTSLLPSPSPCVNICQMDAATGWCAGCLRTLDEPRRRAVLAALPQRRELWLAEGREPAAPPRTADEGRTP